VRALVYDTLYREGEFVAAGKPRRRAPSPGEHQGALLRRGARLRARLKAGDRVAVGIEGLAAPLEATVSYLSPQPEYTPPVLYNRDNRAKLVYMIEAVFAPGAAPTCIPASPSTSAGGSMSAAGELAIDVSGVTKRFGAKTAVNGIDLQVAPRGDLRLPRAQRERQDHLHRMLCGLLTPDAGSGTCLGHDFLTGQAPHQARGRLHDPEVQLLRRT
jgi:hypothetical protein